MGSPDLRSQYEAAVAALRDAACAMLAAGRSEEQVARWIAGERDQLKLSYRALTPAATLAVLEARSLARYGNTLGPTVDQLRAAGRSWADIIDCAARHGALPTGAGPVDPETGD